MTGSSKIFVLKGSGFEVSEYLNHSESITFTIILQRLDERAFFGSFGKINQLIPSELRCITFLDFQIIIGKI